MNNKLSRKLKCYYCGKGMKYKKERSVSKYICTSYDIKGECKRIIIDEETLVNLIEGRFEREFSKSEIQSLVKEVLVKGKYEFVIHFYEHEPIISMNGKFVF